MYHICFVPTESSVCMHLLEESLNNRSRDDDGDADDGDDDEDDNGDEEDDDDDEYDDDDKATFISSLHPFHLDISMSGSMCVSSTAASWQ